MALQMIITNAGRAALVNAQSSGTAPVTIAKVGFSATAVAPLATATVLPGEFKQLNAIGGSVVAPDTIHLVAQDASVEVYTVRSIAAYLADGTLFGIYGQADPLINKSAASLALLAVDVRFVDIAATALTFGNTNFLNPPATTAVQGVVQLATTAETAAGLVTTKAVTPKGVADVYAKLSGATFTGGLAGSMVRATGSNFAGAVGGAVEIVFEGTNGLVQAFDRTAASYRQLILNGLNVTIQSVGGGGIYLASNTAVTGSLSVNSNIVWHAGNDGSGSGLDADLLDGYDSGAFAKLSGATFAGGLGGSMIRASGSTYAGMVGPAAELFYNGSTACFVGFNRTTADHTPVLLRGSSLDLDALGGVISLKGIANLTGALTCAAGIEAAGPLLGTTPNVGTTGGLRLKANAATDQALLQILNADGGQRGFFNFPPSGGVSWMGSTVWHAGNDGSGSGLDADMVDGHHAASLAKLAGDTFTGELALVYAGPTLKMVNPGQATWRSGILTAVSTNYEILREGAAQVAFGIDPGGNCYMPIALSIAGATAWHAGNDGAGSGLDADLLDGRQAGEFALLTGADFSGQVGAATPNNGTTGGIRLKGNASSGMAYLQVLSADGNAQWGFAGFSSGGAFTWGGQAVWHAGSDGSGSGLDADMVDGRHASEFLRVVDAGEGYRVQSDGFKECWGVAALAGSSLTVINLPVAHTSWCVPVGSGVRAAADEQSIGVRDVLGAPPTAFTVRNNNTEPVSFYWHTRGV